MLDTGLGVSDSASQSGCKHILCRRNSLGNTGESDKKRQVFIYQQFSYDNYYTFAAKICYVLIYHTPYRVDIDSEDTTYCVI